MLAICLTLGNKLLNGAIKTPLLKFILEVTPANQANVVKISIYLPPEPSESSGGIAI